jgi:hypothetical protein
MAVRSRPGRFIACLGERILHTATRQPLLDCARILLGEGADPMARIEMRHAGAEYVALSSTIGAAAKLTVAERDRGNGPLFEQWKPRIFSAGASPVDLNGEPVPDIGLEEKMGSAGPAG